MQASFSAGCSETCAWSGRSRSAVHAATVAQAFGSTARTLWIAAPMRAPGASASSSTRSPQAAARAVGEALLHRAQRLGDAAVQVAGVEQGDADAGLARGGQHRRAELVRVRVRATAGVVVHVVELADRRDAGERHLGERRPGEAEVALRVEAGGDLVHLLAPGPEAPAPALGAPAKRAVKGVRVRVGEPGQREPVEPLGARGRLGRRRRARRRSDRRRPPRPPPCSARSPPSQASSHQ